MISMQIFRENDIRGIYGKDLTEEAVYLIGAAFSGLLKKKRKSSVLIGMDIRLSSPAIKKMLIAAFSDNGLKVIDLGLCPTPVFYFAARFEKCASGIMITGSHNPPEYNGMKIVLAGQTLFGDSIRNLGSIAANVARGFSPVIYARKMDAEIRPSPRLSPEGRGKGEGSLQKKDYTKKYSDFVVKNVGKLDRKVKVAVDCGNGTGFVALDIFKRLGAEVHPLFEKPDGNFPNHFPDPTIPAYLAALQKKVTGKSLDMGFAFDGDSDRLGALDDKGGIVSGDCLLLYFSKKVLAEYPGKKHRVIFEVKCTELLNKLIPAYGGVPVMWKTGHSLIEKKMCDEKAILAGEMSGHIYFKDKYFGFDDAIYSAARLLKYFSAEKEPLSKIMRGYRKVINTPEIRLDCPDEIKFAVVKKLKSVFSKRKCRLCDIDGARIYFEDGWGLVRASNTQPVLVLRFEADTAAGLKRIRREIETELKKIVESRK